MGSALVLTPGMDVDGAARRLPCGENGAEQAREEDEG